MLNTRCRFEKTVLAGGTSASELYIIPGAEAQTEAHNEALSYAPAGGGKFAFDVTETGGAAPGRHGFQNGNDSSDL